MSKKKQIGTTPRQFRLKQDTLDNLDAIVAYLQGRDGVPRSRADAVRFAAHAAAEKIRKKIQNPA